MRHRLQTGDLVMFHAAIRQFPCDWEDTPLIFVRVRKLGDQMGMYYVFIDRKGRLTNFCGSYDFVVLSRISEALG